MVQDFRIGERNSCLLRQQYLKYAREVFNEVGSMGTTAKSMSQGWLWMSLCFGTPLKGIVPLLEMKACHDKNQKYRLTHRWAFLDTTD